MLGKTDKKDQIGSVDQRPLTKGQLISKANYQTWILLENEQWICVS